MDQNIIPGLFEQPIYNYLKLFEQTVFNLFNHRYLLGIYFVLFKYSSDN